MEKVWPTTARRTAPPDGPHGRGRPRVRQRGGDHGRSLVPPAKEPVCNWQLICLLANCPDPALRDPPRAVDLAQRVLPPTDGEYWRYLVLAQYRRGDWPAARRHPTGDGPSPRRRCNRLAALGDGSLAARPATNRRSHGTPRHKPRWQRERRCSEYFGVMAVDRLRREAQRLWEDQTADQKPEGK